MRVLDFTTRAGYMLGICAALSACDETDCGGADLAEYRISNYTMQFSEFYPAETLSSESSRLYAPENPIDPLNFALELDGEVEWVAHAGDSRGWLRFSWFAEAYACSPVAYQLPAQRLVRYEITSTANFPEFPAGTDISPLFLEEYRDAPSASSISPFVEGDITEDEIPPKRQALRLAAIPLDATHVFTITIELDDGSYYQFISPTVTFDLGP